MLFEKGSAKSWLGGRDVVSRSNAIQITEENLHCCYYGIDRARTYGNDESDFRAMTEFYELDLTKLDFGVITDSFFDVIIMSHVIEHLYNGDAVLDALLRKLKRGGISISSFLHKEAPGSQAKRGR